MYAIREIFPHLSESSARAFFPFPLFLINAFSHHRYSSLGHFKKQLSLGDSQLASWALNLNKYTFHAGLWNDSEKHKKKKKKKGEKKPLCSSNFRRREPASSSFREHIDSCDVFWAVHRLSVRLLVNSRKDARIQTGS